MEDCKCGAPWEEKNKRWSCGTVFDNAGVRLEPPFCTKRQGVRKPFILSAESTAGLNLTIQEMFRAMRSVTVVLESLNEFHRGVETQFHRLSADEITPLEYAAETAKLLITLPRTEGTTDGDD